ncbi:MAG: hypothetical protein QHH15_00375 [Candidatus Thermoplasmatota archaeon]|nr:hypothetical protein [Candidatus Thermoplasmatota archaeon]
MSYIGNSNTKRLHSPYCRAVPMIAPKHIVNTNDGEGFPVYCHWCKNQGYGKGGRQMVFDEFMDLMGSNVEICYDKKYLNILTEVGCLQEHGIYHEDKEESKGIVLMYPHDGGYVVEGKEGKWWIYYQCEVCGYQTSLVKAMSRLARNGQK